jgi:hypothetical protein
MSPEIIAETLKAIAIMHRSVKEESYKDELKEHFDSMLGQLFKHEADEIKPLDLGVAVNTLTTALDKDPDLYYGYQSNIAMAIVDEWNQSVKTKALGAAAILPTDKTIHTMANAAAKRFLNQLIKSTNPKSDE